MSVALTEDDQKRRDRRREKPGESLLCAMSV
jgi:hypothetical protein